MDELIIIDKNEMKLILESLATQVLDSHSDYASLCFVGIQRRGADLAKRLAKNIKDKTGVEIPVGTLDINLYRDDWAVRSEGSPQVSVSSMPFNIDDRKIVLIDDVLFSGRTVRAALDALFDYGRPEFVELLTFIDRGFRQLPISPNYTGKKISARKDQHVDVFLEERDGKDAICISK